MLLSALHPQNLALSIATGLSIAQASISTGEQVGVVIIYVALGSLTVLAPQRALARAHPVWVLRYRLPSGKDSRRTLGKAWLKASGPPANSGPPHNASSTSTRRRCPTTGMLRRALDDFIAHSERERKLRASTLAEYHRIANWLGARPWRAELTWRERPLTTRSR